MKRINMKRVALFAIIFTLAAGCKKLDLAPEDRFTDLTYWSSPAKALSMLNTAYSQIYNTDNFFYNEALSDNAYSRNDVSGSNSIATGAYDASLSRLKNEWNDHYKGIKSCNLLLSNIDKVPQMDETLKNRMKAEARLLRAFQYFQLMTWFGGVPLFDKDIDINTARSIQRSPRAEVLDFILKELDLAVGDLPTNTTLPEAERGRLTKGAAIALKARVLLYESRWQEAADLCQKLIGGTEYGTYSLFPSYEGVFLPQNEYNSEVILDIEFVPVKRAWGTFFDLAPISAGARLNAMAPTQELVDSYMMLNGKRINESGSGYNESDPYKNRDPRLSYTVVYHGYNWKNEDGSTRTIYIRPGSDPSSAKTDEYSPGSSKTPTGYYLRKYFDPTHDNNLSSGLNLILIRYADVLLMYAEAKNELSKLDESAWNQTVKALRSRAGFTDAAALNYNNAWSQEDLRQIIRNERRVELAMEGQRIFDIRRWKIAETVLNGWVHGAKYGPANEDNGYIRASLRNFDKGKHYLWPVPREERSINPNLSQNPGWN
ncbi:RagB/SusD family nutrient uptake outer membrane protein [Arcticibacter sp. MXS-1]|uniref:RagB/SusD family nutrient uptake outer membrane protein n=1 Tax=Arcticibacter sp. MXS-1 TaxID=3341726 RepID=UPI0035A8641F